MSFGLRAEMDDSSPSPLCDARLLQRQECGLFHRKTATVLAIEAPQQYGESARRRELKEANVQTPKWGMNGARRGHPRHAASSGRHYPENGSTVSARTKRERP